MTAFGMRVCPACVDADQQATQERRAGRGDPYDPVYYGPHGPSRLEREFAERAEQAAVQFAIGYGVDPQVGWTDEQLDRALADHNLPAMASLPGRAEGRMAQAAATDPDHHHSPEEQAHGWRRVNAAHLLGHVLAHNGQRCIGCKDW